MPRTDSIIPERLLTLPRLAAVALCLLLGACSSATHFFYNRLDVVLPWYLERYVDLDGAQSDYVDARLEALLDWHRRDELPRYVTLLDDVLAGLDEPVTTGVVIEFSDAVEAAWYRLRDRGLEELLLLGERLSDRQIAEFIEELEERQRKYERKYLPRDDEEYRDDAADSLRDNLEDYLGRLSPAQRERVTVASRGLIRSDALWLTERQRLIDMLRRELRREPGWQQRVRSQIVNWESSLDAASESAYEHNTAVVQAAVAVILQTRSAEQDERLRRELTRLREDFLELAGEPD